MNRTFGALPPDPPLDGSRELADLVAGLPRLGDGAGLHRMRWFLDLFEADDWLAELDVVKITGSKGKGSVGVMTAAVFEELGISHGLYSSPHLRRWNERIVIAGESVGDEELMAACRYTAERLEEWHARCPHDRFGIFDALTAVALVCFARRRVPALIAEVGAGGRFDPVRVLPGPLAALTSLELEHTDFLGETLEQIAYNKADLCPDGGTLVVGAGLDAEILRRLRGYARVRGIRLVAVDDVCRLLDYRRQGAATSIDVELRGQRLAGIELALAGRHQWSNAIVAFLLAEDWMRRHRPRFDTSALLAAWRRGVARARLAGRFQQVAREPEIWIDVCHTAQSAAALVELVQEALAGHRILLVHGISTGRDFASVGGPLVGLADAVVCTRSRHRGLAVEDLDELVGRMRPELPRWQAATAEEALVLARREAVRGGMTVLVAGSFFLCAEVAETVAGHDPGQLRFFGGS